MRKSLFLIAVLLFGIIQAHALDYISIQDYDSDVESICMEMTDTITVSVDPTWESGLDLHSWILAGDVSFANGYGANSNPCKIVVPSDGYGKGRVSYKYKEGRCSSVEYFDVFKSFACPQWLEIKGPECIVDSQEVVYSVDPMLTKNLGAQIGIDSYKWNVLESNQPFVHEILYVSSDSSSITFKVGQVNPQNPPVITVSVGQCNDWELSKTLGNATPKPELQDTMYLPVGFGDVKVGVINPKPNMEYTWACPSFAIEPYGVSGDSAIIHITGQDADKMEFEVYVNATYTDITCNTSADTMKVVRTWGHTGIVDKNNITDSCYTQGTSYDFAVEGELPITTKCKWTLPQGWNVSETSALDLKTITIYPTSSAKLKDTLFVKPLDAHDSASPDTLVVHVKPIPVPVNRIMQNSCLQYNEESVVYVDTTGLNMPEEVWFEWSAPHAETLSALGTDTLRFIPSMQTNTVSVIAKGINSCDAASTDYTLVFEPQTPGLIICEGCECISVNMPDTLKFYVANGQSTQTYSWTYTSNLTPLRINNDTIELITNGTPNAKDTVWVKAIQDNQNCPKSDSIYRAISIGMIDDGFYVRYKPKRQGKTELLDEDEEDENVRADYRWYLLYNQKEVLNAYLYPTQESPYLLDNTLLLPKLGNASLPSGYVIMVEFVPMGECSKKRLTYPENALPSTFSLDSTISISQLPDLPSNMMPRRRTLEIEENGEIELLQLYPNPTNQILHANLQNNYSFEIRIVTMDGEIVYISNDNHKQYDINVSSFPQGRYLVTAFRDGRRIASGIFIKK